MPTKSQPIDHPLSEMLDVIGRREPADLPLQEMVEAFGERSFGAMLLILGLLSVLIGAIPGTTTVLAIPILLISLQLILRRHTLWLPRFVLERSLERARFAQAVGKAIKPLRMLERISRPRLGFMNTDLSEMLIGLICAGLALILMLPLLGFNLAPSLIVAAFGFGLTQRDGVVMLVAWLGTAGFTAFGWLAWEVVSSAAWATWQWALTLVGG